MGVLQNKKTGGAFTRPHGSDARLIFPGVTANPLETPNDDLRLWNVASSPGIQVQSTTYIRFQIDSFNIGSSVPLFDAKTPSDINQRRYGIYIYNDNRIRLIERYNNGGGYNVLFNAPPVPFIGAGECHIFVRHNGLISGTRVRDIRMYIGGTLYTLPFGGWTAVNGGGSAGANWAGADLRFTLGTNYSYTNVANYSVDYMGVVNTYNFTAQEAASIAERELVLAAGQTKLMEMNLKEHHASRPPRIMSYHTNRKHHLMGNGGRVFEGSEIRVPKTI